MNREILEIRENFPHATVAKDFLAATPGQRLNGWIGIADVIANRKWKQG